MLLMVISRSLTRCVRLLCSRPRKQRLGNVVRLMAISQGVATRVADGHRSCLHRSVAEPAKELAVVAERWPQLLCSRLGRGGCCSRFLLALLCT